jgi:predicted nuclease of predicted toxin-antitoxin system
LKIFVDENIPSRTVEALRSFGHDVVDIRGTPDQGLSDSAIWNKVAKEQRLLITTDKGFLKNRYQQHSGILIIRLRQPTESKIHDRIMLAVNTFPAAEWPRMAVVMRDQTQNITRN